MTATVRRLLTAGLAALVLLAVPAAAGAAPAPSVSATVERADRALDRTVRAVLRGDATTALRQLRVNRRESARANRRARALTRRARRSGRVAGAAHAATLVAEQYDVNLETYAALVDRVHGPFQAALARALQPSLNGREQALELVAALLGRAPAGLLDGLGGPFAALAGDAEVEVARLADALHTELPALVGELVQQALTTASAAVQVALARLEELSAELPADAAGPLAGALASVQEALAQVGPVLDGLVASATELATEITGLVLDRIEAVCGAIDGLLGGVLDGVIGGVEDGEGEDGGPGLGFEIPGFGLPGFLEGLFPRAAATRS